MKENQDDILKRIAESEYKQGFVTDLELEYFPKGLTEETVRLISEKNKSPIGCCNSGWMLFASGKP